MANQDNSIIQIDQVGDLVESLQGEKQITLEIRYYHLEDVGIKDVLPTLIEKSLANKWNCLIKSPSNHNIAMLDEVLWNYDAHSFIPHLVIGTNSSAKQRQQATQTPVLLSTDHGIGGLNQSKILFLLDEAEEDEANYQSFVRICRLFIGNDTEQLNLARKNWVKDRDAGYNLSYWQKMDNGWVQKQ